MERQQDEQDRRRFNAAEAAALADFDRADWLQSVEGNDHEEDGQPKHILDINRASKESKETSALVHFNAYLDNYFKSNGLPVKTAQELEYSDIQTDLMGRFLTYLAYAKSRLQSHARRPEAEKPFLAYNTALGYSSAIKSYLTTKFKNEKEIPCFGKAWSTALGKFRALCNERNRKEGKRVVTPKASAQKSDYLSLATLCIWLGRNDLIEFWFFNVACIHLAARGNEIAYLMHQHVNIDLQEEAFQKTYLLAEITVNNWKESTCQDLHVFPHIDSWYKDFYFASAVFLALSDEATQYLCPSFANAAKMTKQNKANTSGISRYWGTCLAGIQRYYESIKEHLNSDTLMSIAKDICCHSGMKHVVDAMAMANISPFSFIFRVGWDTRNVHSVFDYMEGTRGQDIALQNIYDDPANSKDSISALSVNYLEEVFRKKKVVDMNWPSGTPEKDVEWFCRRAGGRPKQGATAIKFGSATDSTNIANKKRKI